MSKYNELCKLTKNFHILYVEDDEQYRKNTYEILEHFFTRIDTASNGKEAYHQYLEFFKTSQKYYDMVLTDVTMPELNGLELTKKIYQQNEKQMIIVISAYDSPEYLLEFVNIGIEYFLVKPFELEKLFEVLYNSSLKLHSLEKNRDETTIKRLNNNFYWDCKRLVLLKNKVKVKLTKKEILLMQLFMDNTHKAVSFGEIYDVLWGIDRHLASTHNLNPIISRLKKKLPDNLITNIYGFGYRFTL
jgi:DNA-binding response OmpR family regulator